MRNYEYCHNGLKAETMIISFLRSKGFTVQEASVSDNIVYDTDCWINGVPISIKTQHSGLTYKNIYLELASQHYSSHDWDLAWVDAINKYTGGRTFKDGWYPSWWFTGKAEQYLILQGNTLRLYDKNMLQDIIDSDGFLRTRTLSPRLLSKQNGKNTLCGYLSIDTPFIQEWLIPQEFQENQDYVISLY